jgi:hypothetical protein
MLFSDFIIALRARWSIVWTTFCVLEVFLPKVVQRLDHLAR